MTPSIGRIVHYVSYGTPGGEFTSECRAAVIAAVNGGAPPRWGSGGERLEGEEPTLSLVVFNPQGLFFNECEHDEDEKKGGTWHWPERVEASGGVIENPSLYTVGEDGPEQLERQP